MDYTTMNLILWGSMAWLPWLLYFMLKNEARPKKNIVVGVTLPWEARGDSQVLALLETYKRELKAVTWLCTLSALPGMLIRSFGLSMTVWMVWIVAICLMPNVPYVRCNRALRRLKEARGWRRQSEGCAAVDLTAAAEEMKWISPWLFLPPVLISLIPLFFEPELWLLWGVLALTVVLFYMCYRWCFRARSEMVDGDTERTVALTRIRRYNWGKTWVLMAWMTGILTPLIWLTLDHIWWNMAVFLVYTVGVMWAVFRIEFRVRRLQEELSAGSGQGYYVDEDDQWLWGMFYYNPNDSRLMVNARVGMNTAVNLARPAGKALMGLTAVLLASLPLFGIWLMGMERADVELTVTETELTASHFGKEYAIPLEEMERAELVEQLPPMARVAGMGMPSACTGKWTAEEWGRFTCCIDPREGPWLLLETSEGGLYLFGGGENSAAEQVLPLLQK